jgi:endo-1,4-beta-D-glucanase Y
MTKILEFSENIILCSSTTVVLIEVIQMELKPEWVSKYLTPEQRKTMRDLAKKSFSQEALRKLAKQEFTEETHQQYSYFRAELKRLVAANADPGSPEAQNLAQYLTDLNKRRSQGDEEIIAGMKKAWDNFNALPDDMKPQIYVLTTEERVIQQSCTILHKQRRDDEYASS